MLALIKRAVCEVTSYLSYQKWLYYIKVQY